MGTPGTGSAVPTVPRDSRNAPYPAGISEPAPGSEVGSGLAQDLLGKEPVLLGRGGADTDRRLDQRAQNLSVRSENDTKLIHVTVTGALSRLVLRSSAS